MTKYYSEVLARALWGFLNYLCLPAALKYRGVCVYNPLMISIHAYKYATENQPDRSVLERHREIAFPHPSLISEVHSNWHLSASLPMKGNCFCVLCGLSECKLERKWDLKCAVVCEFMFYLPSLENLWGEWLRVLALCVPGLAPTDNTLVGVKVQCKLWQLQPSVLFNLSVDFLAQCWGQWRVQLVPYSPKLKRSGFYRQA